jgi:hypothetical protein
MADSELQDDDRDTSLPSSALSPAEYRGFRGLVSELDHTSVNNQVSLYSVLEFLASFNGVTHSVAQKVFFVFMALTEGCGDGAWDTGRRVRSGRSYLCYDSLDRALANRQTDRKVFDFCSRYSFSKGKLTVKQHAFLSERQPLHHTNSTRCQALLRHPQP